MKKLSVHIKLGTDLEKEIKREIDERAVKIVDMIDNDVPDTDEEFLSLCKETKELEVEYEDIDLDQCYYFLTDESGKVVLDFQKLFFKHIEDFVYISNVEQDGEFFRVEYDDSEYDVCCALLDKKGRFILKKYTNHKELGSLLVVEALGYMLEEFDLHMDSRDFYFYAVDTEGNTVIPPCISINFDEETELFEVEELGGQIILVNSEGDEVSE